jgi:hypothetical protein
MSLTIAMHDPVGQILDELTRKGITQASVALTYAFIIAQEPKADWLRINTAIRAKWGGRTALERVKRMAWRQLEEWKTRHQPL